MSDGDTDLRGRAGVDPSQQDLAARRRVRRQEADRRRTLRRRSGLIALIALVGATAAAIAATSDGGSTRRHPDAQRPRASEAASRSSHASAPSTARHLRAGGSALSRRLVVAASLPQTSALPSNHDATFKALMASLWAGIVQDSVTTALPAFFPKQAYAQLKAIPSAGTDWSGRLVREYGLDIGAAHSLLGSDATGARLLAVHVQASYAHWVPPGVCYNSAGYYEMPGARIVYRAGGATHSFGIASMISWRGVWYVVHLGAILRSEGSGVVDEPSSGPGAPAYSGTC